MSNPASSLRHEAFVRGAAGWLLPERKPVVRWGFAVLDVLAALGTRVALDPLLPRDFPYPTFFPAVLLTAAVAGTAPAVVVAVACALSTWFFFVPPLRSFDLTPPEAIALLLFGVVSATEVALVHLMRGALRLLWRAEAEALSQARTRSLMFAELQHRVSNNLAVVGSLLSMRRREVADPVACRALDEAAVRLEIVARVSRRLHDPAAQEMDLGEALGAMIPEILAICGAQDRIVAEIDVECVMVPAARAVLLALIATELVSNAIEHGFPDGESGRMEVTLARTGEATACFVLRHDGVALPVGFRLSRVRSLGLRVATQLAEQAGADLMLVQDRGVVSCLSFPTGDAALVPGRTDALPRGPGSIPVAQGFPWRKAV